MAKIGVDPRSEQGLEARRLEVRAARFRLNKANEIEHAKRCLELEFKQALAEAKRSR